VSYDIQGFSNESMNFLPVYYTTELEDMDLLSTDLTQTMLLYADMAYGYKTMSDITDMMDIGHDVLSERKIGKMKNGKPVMSFTRNANGRSTEQRSLIDTAKSNFLARLDDLYSMNIYGKYRQGNEKMHKISDALMQGTALNSFAFNLMAGTANIATGTIQMRIEGIAKQFFSTKDIV
jgi:hypothetical protein